MFTRNIHVADAGPPALSDAVAGPTVNLNIVPEDVHWLILSELAETSFMDVLNVAHSSNALRHAALPFMYHNVTLEKGLKKSGKQNSFQALIQSFRQDEKGELARQVRSVTVKDEVPSEDLIMLLHKIARYGNLRSLNWETSAHMSHEVFDMLHTNWPTLEINVAVPDRQNAKFIAHRQMDMKLLSSPLLVGLTYVVYTQGYQPDKPCHSDWPRLSQALTAGGKIRSLRIRSLPDGDPYDGIRIVPDTDPKGLPRLDFASGLHLPRLEELSIEVVRLWGESNYLWDLEHSCMLRDSIDGSRLRKLDFGMDNPETFFRCFTGVLPNLKSLRFGAAKAATESAKVFIESLEALEHLDIAQAQTGIDDLWPAIEQHRSTLRTLVLGPALGHYCSRMYMDLSRLETVAATFPILERLGWDAPCSTNVDARHLEVLSSMRLKKLDLYLHIPDEASEFSEKLVQDAWGTIAPPLLDKKGSISAAISIAEIVSESQQGVLQWLTLQLSRTGYSDRYQPYMMYSKLQLRRNSYTGEIRGRKWDVRGSMDWYGVPSFEEDLRFEEE
ncbi:uncharacterized protein M421DRAFT_8898 [Didymella exigua CBS 183.55]|uniref:Uncharacterized protein n=1 Tax=Didymella exigua CBS 183.55 TaxID=1150837 RepID=A0A6A5REW1_9PLEO|nr:uncharacterized protein M421DRAFT_8898 [Didymella exigua CBS 183.55]KAF1924237.1 hypothetical protein M421DRAFT_8898 [Didymella exigua CBS 183.55]